MTQTDTYAMFGVNLAEGNAFSQFASEICRASYHNSPFVKVVDLSKGHFRGPKGYDAMNLPNDFIWTAGADGIGTKVIIIDAAGQHQLSPRDAFAMTGGDITRWGGKPLLFVNVLDVSTLDKAGTPTNNAARAIMRGLGEVAREQHVVCFQGETAELSQCVGSENPDATLKYNWAGFMVGAFLPDRVITGESLAEGQVVVALRERGPRSNGLSKIRGGLKIRYGDDWWQNPEAQDDIRAAAVPSTLYDRFLSEVNGWVDPIQSPMIKVHLVAHISGGGIVEKFGADQLFRYGFSAELDHLFEPPEILKKTMEWTGAAEAEAYSTFSSGNGALVVLDPGSARMFVSLAAKAGIEAGVCGTITKSNRQYLRIKSGYSGQDLEYYPT